MTSLERKKRLLGDSIQRVRRARELTQKELTELAGITQAHLSQIERGEKNPTVETLSKLADALRVRLARFFDWQNLKEELARLRKQNQRLGQLLREVAPEIDLSAEAELRVTDDQIVAERVLYSLDDEYGLDNE